MNPGRRRGGEEEEHTLYPYMDIILGLLCVASVFVSFGEGVCGEVGHVSALCFKSEDDHELPRHEGRSPKEIFQ